MRLRGAPARFGRPYLPDPVVQRDAFTGTNGTLLTAHAMDSGGTWTKHPVSGTANPVIQSNRAWTGSGGGTIIMTSQAMGTADYDVSANYVLITDNASSLAGVQARIAPPANTGISLHYNTTDDSLKLFEFVAGVNGPVTSIPLAPLVAQKITLRVRGTRAAALVDGVEVGAITTTVTAAGFPGLRFGGTSSSTVGVHLDNFEVVEAGPLRWAAPDTTGWTEVHANNTDRSLTLGVGPTVVVIDEPITALGGLVINGNGGQHVAVIGGEFDFTAAATGRTASQMRMIDFLNFTGHVYAEGLLFKGAPHDGSGNSSPVAGAMGDAFNFHSVFGGANSRALITIQNCRAEHLRSDCLDQQNGTGAYVANEVHSDGVQIYSGGPQFGLRMDKCTFAPAYYQGIFNQSGQKPPMDLSRINIDGRSGEYLAGTAVSAYLLSASSNNTAPQHIHCDEVYLQAPEGKSASQYVSHAATGSTIGFNPGRAGRYFTWTDGIPPLGDWCPAGVAGMDYVSPGYQG